MPEKNKIAYYALVDALLTALYVACIGTFFFNAQAIFGKHDTVMIPIVLLLLFVFSAALTSALVLGKPVLWYIEGKKKEALTLFFYTLAVFFFVILIMLVALYAVNRF